MQYKTKNGAGTTSEALTEPQALDHAVRKETETPVDPHMELKIVEQAGTLGTSNKLLVLEQDSEEEAEKPVEALTEQQAVDQVVKQEAETPQDSPTDLGTVEQYETLRRSNKLTVEQHDKEEAGKPAETCTEPKAVEQEVLKEAERPVDLPMDLEAVEQAETLRRSNKLLAVDQDSKEEEAEKQAGASSKLQILEHDTKHVAEKSAEAMQSQPPEKTAAHSLRNIVKEAAVKSLFNTTIGKAALKVKKKIVKKNKGVSLVINEGSRNGEETRSAKEEFAEQENKKETETPVVVSTKFQSSEQETGKEAEMPVETCVQAKAKASEKRTLDSLKARTKLMKKALPKTADGKAAPNKVQKIIVKKNKGVPLVLNERSGHSEAMPRESAFPQDNPRIGTATDGKNTARNERKDNSHGEDKNGKHPASADINESENMQSKEENVGKFRREKKCKNGQNHSSNDRSDNPKKEKIDNVGVQQRKMAREKKEKTGGLIFLCSAKTKPDCLNYRVMGLPESQKNMVLGIKPGLKLFLYDYDLKLMYGIYKSSSAGGKKLEPRAFGGAFPYQVRFKIHVDCFPLPESIFKKAMVENFVTKHKFKTELTTRQVRKLSELFQPLETHPMVGPQLNNLPAYSAREERARDGVSHLSVRKLQRCSERETYRNDHCASRDERRYPLLAHDRDQHFANQGVREEPIREMVLTEKEYRSYGLRGERSNSDLPSRTAPASDPYWGDYKRRRQLDVVHLDAVPSRREYVYAGSSSLDYQDYQACSFDPRREYPLADRYPDYLRRVNISSSEAYGTESDHDLHTREVDPADRIFSRSQPAEYDLRRYWVMDPDSTTLPVSSRYSFVGRG